MGATYQLPDGIWMWSAGHRQPPQAIRHEAAAANLDALDDCSTDEEIQACYGGAIEALASTMRHTANPLVVKIDVKGADRWSFGGSGRSLCP